MTREQASNGGSQQQTAHRRQWVPWLPVFVGIGLFFSTYAVIQFSGWLEGTRLDPNMIVQGPMAPLSPPVITRAEITSLVEKTVRDTVAQEIARQFDARTEGGQSVPSATWDAGEKGLVAFIAILAVFVAGFVVILRKIDLRNDDERIRMRWVTYRYIGEDLEKIVRASDDIADSGSEQTSPGKGNDFHQSVERTYLQWAGSRLVWSDECFKSGEQFFKAALHNENSDIKSSYKEFMKSLKYDLRYR